MSERWCTSTGGHAFIVAPTYQFFPSIMMDQSGYLRWVKGTGTWAPAVSFRCLYCGARL